LGSCIFYGFRQFHVEEQKPIALDGPVQQPYHLQFHAEVWGEKVMAGMIRIASLNLYIIFTLSLESLYQGQINWSNKTEKR